MEIWSHWDQEDWDAYEQDEGHCRQCLEEEHCQREKVVDVGDLVDFADQNEFQVDAFENLQEGRDLFLLASDLGKCCQDQGDSELDQTLRFKRLAFEEFVYLCLVRANCPNRL